MHLGSRLTAHRPILALLLLVGLLLVPAPGTALVCACMATDSQTRLATADAAFVGTLVSAEPASEQSTVYIFEVQQWAKGDHGPTVTLLAGQDSASCGFSLTAGEVVGLYLHASDTGNNTGNDMSNDTGEGSDLVAGLCDLEDPAFLLAESPPLPTVRPIPDPPTAYTDDLPRSEATTARAQLTARIALAALAASTLAAAAVVTLRRRNTPPTTLE